MRPMRRLSCCLCADRQFLVKVAGKGVLARTPLVVTLWLLPKWWGRAIYENRAQDDAKIYFLPPTSFLRNSIGNQTQSNSIFLRLYLEYFFWGISHALSQLIQYRTLVLITHSLFICLSLQKVALRKTSWLLTSSMWRPYPQALVRH